MFKSLILEPCLIDCLNGQEKSILGKFTRLEHPNSQEARALSASNESDSDFSEVNVGGCKGGACVCGVVV